MSAVKCPWRVLSATPLLCKRGPFWQLLPKYFLREYDIANPFPVLCVTTRLSFSNGKDSGGFSHPPQVTLALQGARTKSELQVLISACPGAPWLGRRYQQEPQRHHSDVTDSSGASEFVSRSQQGAEKLLSGPNSHERKTKFHHNVDHLWLRMIFQERPLERGMRKIKTVVLREHDMKGITDATKQYRLWHSNTLFYLPKLLFLK